MAKSIRDILKFTSEEEFPQTKTEGAIDRVKIFQKEFDESIERKDQFSKFYNVNSFGNSANYAIDKVNARESDEREFLYTNDSMIQENVRARTDPDGAPPTISRETLQSFTKANVNPPVSSVHNLRLSEQNELNYRVGNIKFIDHLNNNDLSNLKALRHQQLINL